MSLFEAGREVGRYKLLGRLATGGMAEIYLARQSGPSGFSKVLVVKVILPNLASDENFMRMFANEAKLAALLNHPNVVQVFDYGEEQGLPYMAMEYIDGRNMSRISKALHQKGERIPRAFALRVISEVCGALEYAHNMCDSEGNHLKIVHRDISRDNILLTYSGRVKLVDFGIAKSSIIESYTTEGTIKGKYAYMAPEVIRGEESDHLIDIYALGVVLYSMLVGRMPFRAKNHAQLLEMILHTEPPAPREIDPTLPAELEEIILKAMHKDQEERFAHVSELQHSLESFLVQYETAVYPYHLAQFMAATFPPGSDKERETYRSLTGATPHTPSVRKKSAPAMDPVDDVAHDDPFAAARRTRNILIAIAAVLFVGISVLLYMVLTMQGQPAGPPPVVAGPAVTQKPDARIGQQPDAAMVRQPAPDTAVARQQPDTAVARQQPDAAVARQPAPDMRVPAPRPVARPVVPPQRRPRSGLLSIDAPGPGEVLLQGKRVGSLPLVKQRLPAGTHRVTVRSKALGYSMQRAVTVAPGSDRQLQLRPRKGTIRVLVHPWAKVTLDGKLRGVTPLKPISVYEGPHLLVLENSDVKQTSRRRVMVRPGKESTVKVILE